MSRRVGLRSLRSFSAADRPCAQPTELGNRYVRAHMDRHGDCPPTEQELLRRIVKELTGHRVRVHFSASNREDQVRSHLQARPSLAQADIYVPGNAPAMPGDALQIRRVIRELYPDFDKAGDQFWFSQHRVELARTPRQANNVARYQRPLTFFSALARFVRELYLLNR